MVINSKIFKVLPSPEDERDFLASSLLSKAEVIDTTDTYFNVMDSTVLKVYDQIDTSECTGFSSASMIRLNEYKENKTLKDFAPSYSYGNRNADEYQGEGAYLREVIKHLVAEGMCELSYFNMIGTYDAVRTAFLKLPQTAHENASKYKLNSYYKVNFNDTNEVKKVLKKYKNALLISIPIYESITKSYSNGIIPVPQTEKEQFYGGHAIALIGYKMINNKLHYVLVNSWGTSYGDKGIFYLPYDYPIYEMWLCIDYKKVEVKLQIDNTKYTVNGVEKVMDTKPIIKENRTFVPVRVISENFGYDVFWNPSNKEIKIEEYAMDIVMYIGEKVITNVYTLTQYTADVAPFINAEGRTMIPARAISEILKLNVLWDDKTRTVTIRNY